MDLTVDFCVVGGGPAGLTLAVLLARSGGRVALVERTRSLDRAYRGEILQPGGMALLDQLGVLAGARERGSHEHSRFRYVDRDRVLLDADYRALPAPYNHLLSLPQRHLLAELRAAGERADVTFLDGYRVSDTLVEGGRVTGVLATPPDRGDVQVVRAHCVVAADGRFSKVRQVTGIPNDRNDVFRQDVLWFSVALDEDLDQVQIFRGGGNPVLAYRSWPNRLQLGWTLPHGGYRKIAALGVDHVREQIVRAVPRYGALIRSSLTSLAELTLLDVFAASARYWVTDGLLLIGDAAHTHSPIGAQGINLAVQDAVVAHPILMASLTAGDASAATLGRYTRTRRPDIARVARMQVMQSRAMLSTSGLAARVRPAVAGLVSRTPAFRSVLRRIAYGNPSIRVASELFVHS